MMRQLLIVGAGGCLGSMLRFALTAALHRPAAALRFPLGTLAVNLIGCLAIGALVGLAESLELPGREARLFLWVGLLGGFTTFSAFGADTFVMLRDGEPLRAAASVGVHVVAGLLAVWVGFTMVRG